LNCIKAGPALVSNVLFTLKYKRQGLNNFFILLASLQDKDEGFEELERQFSQLNSSLTAFLFNAQKVCEGSNLVPAYFIRLHFLNGFKPEIPLQVQ
jgi:hypothetical protein